LYKNVFFHENINITLTLLLFILSFVVKFGIAPLHLFKLEVYKGLPFISIFFYTTYYFSIFFVFILFLFYFAITSIDLHLYYFFLCLIFLSIPYLIIILFDVNFIKTFFAYSTVLNTLNFVLIILLNVF
jgi:NADH:ubiquinone oxidoreductase subunit 2 (subunit N)